MFQFVGVVPFVSVCFHLKVCMTGLCRLARDLLFSRPRPKLTVLVDRPL